MLRTSQNCLKLWILPLQRPQGFPNPQNSSFAPKFLPLLGHKPPKLLFSPKMSSGQGIPSWGRFLIRKKKEIWEFFSLHFLAFYPQIWEFFSFFGFFPRFGFFFPSTLGFFPQISNFFPSAVCYFSRIWDFSPQIPGPGFSLRFG